MQVHGAAINERQRLASNPSKRLARFLLPARARCQLRHDDNFVLGCLALDSNPVVVQKPQTVVLGFFDEALKNRLLGTLQILERLGVVSD